MEGCDDGRTECNAHTMCLGLRDKQSKITDMRRVILKVWYDNREQPTYKKMAEYAAPKLFVDNRQAFTAGFSIFEHPGWLKESGKRGNKIYYDITDRNAYNKYQK